MVVGTTGWCTGALDYSPLLPPALRLPAALLFPLATAAAFWLLRPRRLALGGFSLAAGAVIAGWLAIPASNDRSWQPEVAVAPTATVEGDRVTIHGVRNFHYRSETDFDPHWEDRSYDLRELDSLDVIASYWSGPAIAHILLSFGFGGRDYVAISIETRKERGEVYSTLGGFFKLYELVYVVADERDLIGVRTTYRQPPEDVYLYRVHVPPERIRRLFLDYLRGMNELAAHPRFYNTLTTNCTTGALFHTRVNPGHPPLSWKVLLSGHLPEYLYELGGLDRSLPFPELQRRAWVDERARAADDSPDFSRLIRAQPPAAETSGGDASSSSGTAFQLSSGSKRVMADASFAVSGPRSFWYTTPSWFTRKLITPDEP